MTGAAGGIGRAIAGRLETDGWSVLAVDLVAEVVAFLMGPGGRAFTGVPVTMDLGWTAR